MSFWFIFYDFVILLFLHLLHVLLHHVEKLYLAQIEELFLSFSVSVCVSIMSNNTGSVFINLAVSEAVTRNITDNLETRWLKMILESMKHLDFPNEHYNIVVLIVVVCLLVMLTIRYVIKYKRRFMCQRRNETQHVNA